MVMWSRRSLGSVMLNSLLIRSHIPQGAAAIVCIELTNKRGLPLEPFNINRNMGRVILRSEGVTVAAGWLPARSQLLNLIGVVTSCISTVE